MGSRIAQQVVQQASSIGAGGACQKVAMSTTSAQSAAINYGMVQITPSADCYVREGSNPTAVSDGTDQFLAANVPQVFLVTPGNKLAFIVASGTSSVHIAPVR